MGVICDISEKEPCRRGGIKVGRAGSPSDGTPGPCKRKLLGWPFMSTDPDKILFSPNTVSTQTEETRVVENNYISLNNIESGPSYRMGLMGHRCIVVSDIVIRQSWSLCSSL